MILPQVLEQRLDGSRAALALVAPAGLRYFEGHFPGFPVLPGVVQIGWAAALANRLFGRELVVAGMRRVKFMRLIHPGKRIELELALSENGQRLQYRYFDAEGDYSSGSLELERTA